MAGAAPGQQRYLLPVFRGRIEPDLVFFAFDVPPGDLKRYWLVLDEPPMELRYLRDVADDKGLDWEYTERVLSSRDLDEWMRPRPSLNVPRLIGSLLNCCDDEN